MSGGGELKDDGEAVKAEIYQEITKIVMKLQLISPSSSLARFLRIGKEIRAAADKIDSIYQRSDFPPIPKQRKVAGDEEEPALVTEEAVDVRSEVDIEDVAELGERKVGRGDRMEVDGEAMSQLHEPSADKFSLFRNCWEFGYRKSLNNFESMTLLSPMIFTHCTPRYIPGAFIGRTLQIYSVEVKKIEGFNWPLDVYGVVAARDNVDCRRNPIFLHPRDNSQMLYANDPFLPLTGPVRAIVCAFPVSIEIQLKVKGERKSEDRVLISDMFRWNVDCGQFLRGPHIFQNNHCTMELCFEELDRSVQATILSVRAVKSGSAPFEHGGRVVCYSSAVTNVATSSTPIEIVLFDSKRKPVSKPGRLDLSRHVVSAQLGGKLVVLVQSYSPSGDTLGEHVSFIPEKDNISRKNCDVGGCEVEITVAWSLLVDDVATILLSGFVRSESVITVNSIYLL